MLVSLPRVAVSVQAELVHKAEDSQLTIEKLKKEVKLASRNATTPLISLPPSLVSDR